MTKEAPFCDTSLGFTAADATLRKLFRPNIYIYIFCLLLLQMSEGVFKSVKVIVLVSAQFRLSEGLSGYIAERRTTLILSSKSFT